LLCIDVGCGPATACLAFAASYPGRRFDYVGVDTSEAMRRMGAAVWLAALNEGLIAPGSSSDFVDTWEGLAPGEGDANVLLVFSYFFGNASVDGRATASLADMVRQWRDAVSTRSMVMAYANTDHPLATPKYRAFTRALQVPSRPRKGAGNEWEVVRLKG
jgi:SAM-dependent methyltransferase